MKFIPVVILSATAAWMVPARADTLAEATRTGNFTSSSTSLISVPIDNNGDSSIKVNTIDHDEVFEIIYNAECGVLGPQQADVTIEIILDGHQVDPKSGTHFAFCTATSSTDYSWVGATRQSTFVVPTVGYHTVEVHAAGENGATTWWLGDSALAINE